MKDCIFCKIVNREIPVDLLYEDEQVIAFKDINPQAPIHLLIIPIKHIEDISLLSNEDSQKIMPAIFNAINHLAKELNVDDKGFRIVNNCKADGGQTVNHIHFHLLAGRKMLWPPG